MSAMMAASAPGPIPVQQQQQQQQNYAPGNVTVQRGHSRQQSAAAGGGGGGGGGARPAAAAAAEPSPRRYTQNPRTGAAAGAAVRTGEGGNGTGGAGSAEEKARQIGPASGPQGRAMPPRAANAQRPTTSHQQQSSRGGTAQQKQPQPASFRPTAAADPRRPEPVPQPQGQSHAPRPATSNPPTGAAAAGTSSARGTSSSHHQPNYQQQQSANSSSFPHAFERWEMLSSRWEGLTGYWVSRLEQNRQELSHLPLEQEMSRQITDLAAAGANLFQALIELQRLRASSERKFQRWFFETRADQERAREMSSELERSLRVERQQRADAVAQVEQLDKDKTTAEKMVEETRRELQISREECRRAWEELGRREQEEREVTTSLRDGHPALVGGVQVTPMPMPGVPSRSNSQSNRPRTATGPPNPSAASGPQSEGHSDRSQSGTSAPTPRQPHPLAQEYRQSHPPSQPQSPSPLHPESDLIDLQTQLPPQPTSTAAATARTTTVGGTPSPAYPSVQSPQQQQQSSVSERGFYQQTPASLHDMEGSQPGPPSTTSPVSYATNPMGSPAPTASTSSAAFETDEHGNIVVGSNGEPVMARRPGDLSSEEDEDNYQEGREWGTYPSYDGSGYGGNSGSVGYGGSGGVGIGNTWEPISRHHHPTRLSDVLEEDERATVSDGRRSALG